MVQFYSSVCGCPIFPEPFVEETVLFPLDILSCFVEDSVLYSVPLIYVSVLVPVPYCLDYSFVIELEIQNHHASSFAY